MYLSTTLAALTAAGAATSQETVLGVYIFSRHGDRTAKSTPPTNLTDLGYQEVFTSGTYFRDRYIAADASHGIHGINSDLVKQSQITASAPVDTVLQNSAIAFLQGIYPPVGNTLGSSALRNGTVVQSPLNGYQLIPLETIQTGANSEDAAWLEGATNCANAQISSNNYFISSDYLQALDRTQSFYESVRPMVNSTFTAEQTTYKNAYAIWDLLNVASIHNSSDNFPNADLLTPELLFQLRTLADQHEFNLAYNDSDPIRAIAGSILANEFGAYAGMFSFFGLANMTSVSPDFYGVPDYASTLTWELVTNATVPSSRSSFPSEDQISVRFLFHNGTTSNTSTPIEYALFGQDVSPLPWSQFVTEMNKFAIKSQAHWCNACGNSTGVCSSEALNDAGDSFTTSPSSSNNNSGRSSGGGISKAVVGVIGAMVALAIILLVEILILLLGGFRIVSKKRVASQNGAPSSGGADKP